MTRSILVATAAALACAACYEKYPTDASEQTLKLQVTADSLPADGATLVHVVATIPVDARSSSRTVTFTSNAGTFVDGGTGSASIVAIAGTADTYLRAPRSPGPVRIRTQLGTVYRDTAIRFDTAYAASADLQPGAFAVKAGLSNQITITAYLHRPVGLPTPGEVIRFEAVRADNLQPLGRFTSALPSDADGKVAVAWSAGETDYHATVRIRAIDPRGRLLGETAVDVVAP